MRKIQYKEVFYKTSIFLSDLREEGEGGWEFCYKELCGVWSEYKERVVYKKVINVSNED